MKLELEDIEKELEKLEEEGVLKKVNNLGRKGFKLKDCTTCEHEDVNHFEDPCLECFSKGFPLYLVNWECKS